MQPSRVTFCIPDFRDAESGIEFTEIEVIVETDGEIGDTVKLVDTLQRSLAEEYEGRLITRRMIASPRRVDC